MLNVQTKILFFVLILLANWLMRTETTSADIFAERLVRDNTLKATTLSFSLQNTVNNRRLTNLFITDQLQTGGFDVKAFRIRKEGKMDFGYNLRPKVIEGDEEFCRNLSLFVLLNGKEEYKGELLKFSSTSFLASQGKDDWVMFVGLEKDNDLLKNKTCNFDFVLKSFRQDPDEKQAGFYADRVLTNTLTSGNW